MPLSLTISIPVHELSCWMPLDTVPAIIAASLSIFWMSLGSEL